MWFAIPGLMPTLKKPACLASDHPVCLNCGQNPAFFKQGVFNPVTFAADATCQLCAPYSQPAGCGGVGPNWVSQWYKGPNGPLTRKAANFTAPMGLQPNDITYGNVAGVAGTILVRMFIGPFAEQYGVRLSVTFILVVCCIPGFLVACEFRPAPFNIVPRRCDRIALTPGSIHCPHRSLTRPRAPAVVQPGDVASFQAVRFFISFAGGTFVTTSLWSSTMFAHTVVGLAIATTAGWGNLGGGVTLAMHPVIFSGYIAAGYTNDTAWRCTLVGPPALMLLFGFVVFCFTDDCPTGNFVALKRRAAAAAAAAGGGAVAIAPAKQQGTMGASFMLAARNYRSWILAFNYAFSFGIELVVDKNVVLYFNQAYGMSQYNAGLAGSMFGLTNIFARSLGGYISDAVGPRFGVVGRMWCQLLFNATQSLLMIGFASMTFDNTGINGALGIFTMWAIFLAMANGACFGLVPFVEPTACGGVSAVAGACGNVGAVVGNLIVTIGTRPAFMVLGYLGLCASLTMPLIHFQATREGPGGSLFSGGMPREVAWKDFWTVKGRTWLRPMPRADEAGEEALDTKAKDVAVLPPLPPA